MNRKERRASGARGAMPPGGSGARAPDPRVLAEMFGAAVARHQAGALIEAEHQYRQILTLVPGNAEAESRLGAVLMAQGKTGDALPHFERAAALKPDLFEALGSLAQAYLAVGRIESAIEAACRALELKETPHSKAFFAQCVRSAVFTADNARYRKLLLRALREDWTRPRELTRVCISLIVLDAAVKDCIARVNAAWPARLPASDLFGAAGSSAVAGNDLLRCLLECDPITDVGLERLMTNVRHIMLTSSAANDASDERTLAFYSAVARQCFVNDYVFSTTEAEAHAAQQLRTSIETALAAGGDCPPLWAVTAGAYFPLHAIGGAEALLGRAWPQCVDAMLTQQIKEPLEERRLAATIPVLTAIDDKVSLAVRRQYEESPYPRWAKAGWRRPPDTIGHRPPVRSLDVLIAGCGTGLSTIELAQQAPHARILAIDLSIVSLGYAKRMAQSLDNIEFAQADITRLGAVGRQFDFIDASGVLHHLADPWQGWRLLLSLLRPGGTMQVALYSDPARQNVVAARALIAARGYRPDPDGIRRCREYIVAADDPLLKSLTRWADFYTTNECRDLLFHVQEHRVTLPEIKAFVTASKVNFGGFILDALTAQKFAARYPERAALTDLDRWHAFETGAPGTFANMYQFIVYKPVA